MPEMQVVVFSINNEFCGVESSQVQEIVKYQETTKVPRMPKFIDGLINLRGKVVPVIDLNKRFEIGETEITKKTKIIITQFKNTQVGFVVNDVSEIIKLSEEDMELPPDLLQKSTTTYLRCVGKKGDKLISILNFELILTDGEVKKITGKKFENNKTA